MNGRVMEPERDSTGLKRLLLRGLSTWQRPASCVFLYLAAIVLANLTIVWFGQGMVIVNAFVLIGLDLTSRDRLHDAWHGDGLPWKMVLLIASGSAITWLLNRDAGQITLASFVAFACAAIADTIVYHLALRYHKFVRCNGSNLVSAAVDSVLFPTLAFGGFSLWLTVGQFVAKVAGGFMWSLLLFSDKMEN